MTDEKNEAPEPIKPFPPMPVDQPAMVLPAARKHFDYQPTTFEGALKMAEVLSDSDLVPKDYKGKPSNIFVAMQWGHEIGLRPLQAVQNIAIINGRPSLWGDAMLALVRNSPLCEYVREEFDAEGTAICRVKRKGDVEQVRTFSVQDQQIAGLANRDTHKNYPQRMRQMRARAWALRDVFADVLRGIPMAEEAMDMLPVVDSGPAPVPRVEAPKARSRKPEAKEEAPNNDAAVADATPASEAMVKHVERIFERRGKSWADLTATFPDTPAIDSGSLTVAHVNRALQWVKDAP